MIRRGARVLAGLALVVAAVTAAPAAHAAEEADGCALGALGQWLHLPGCDAPGPGASPAPSPSGSPIPGIPAVPGVPGVPGDPGVVPPSTLPPGPTAAPSASPPAAEPADAAPVFTADPPVLSGSAVSLEGLHDLRIVEVRHADGSTARSLRISADRVVVEGFHLDVPSGDGGLANDDERMIATGHVVVYADSLTGILATGADVVVDTLSAPPSVDALRELTRVHLPLIGMTADSVVHVRSHQAVHE